MSKISNVQLFFVLMFMVIGCLLTGAVFTSGVSNDMVFCIVSVIVVALYVLVFFQENAWTMKTEPPYLDIYTYGESMTIGTYWWLKGKEKTGKSAPPSVMSDRNLFLGDDFGIEEPKRIFFTADGSSSEN